MLKLANKTKNQGIEFGEKKLSRYTKEAKEAFKGIAQSTKEIAASSERLVKN